MKIFYEALIIIISFAVSSCGTAAIEKKPETPRVEKPAAVIPDPFETASADFKKTVRDIPFHVDSAVLNLNSPEYSVNGRNIDEFMKNSLLPSLENLIKVMPAGKYVVIDGYASRTGSEEAGKYFIGNIALSKKRAEAILEYIIKNSGIDRSKFSVRANGSSQQLEGIDPADNRNCRVSMTVE